MNRRELIKAAACVVAMPSMAGVFDEKQEKLAIRAVPVCDSGPTFDIKPLEANGRFMTAVWQVKKKCHVKAYEIYVDDKIVFVEDLDADMNPGDTITMTLPQKMYEKILKAENSGKPVKYV